MKIQVSSGFLCDGIGLMEEDIWLDYFGFEIGFSVQRLEEKRFLMVSEVIIR